MKDVFLSVDSQCQQIMKPQQMGVWEFIPSIHTGPWETPRTLDLMLSWTQKRCPPHLEGLPLSKLKGAFGRKTYTVAFLETQTSVL